MRKQGEKMEYDILSLDFNSLSVRQLYEILRLRENIFIVEQDCPYHDIDGVDYNAVHVMCIVKEDGQDRLAAYARVYYDETVKQVKIGRVITASQYRRFGLASKVMKSAIAIAHDRFNAKEIWLHAQTYAIPFYEGVGFKVASEQFLEDGIPHKEMVWTNNCRHTL